MSSDSNLSSEQEEQLKLFSEVTANDNRQQSLQLMEMANWNLERAVDLHMSGTLAGTDAGGHGSSHAVGAPAARAPMGVNSSTRSRTPERRAPPQFGGGGGNSSSNTGGNNNQQQNQEEELGFFGRLRQMAGRLYNYLMADESNETFEETFITGWCFVCEIVKFRVSRPIPKA